MLKNIFIEWCTRGPWFNFKTVKTYMAPYFSGSFFTSCQDIYDLMCGLRAYDKQNDKLTYAKKIGSVRPLPEYSEINPLIYLCVGINFIYTWLNSLKTIVRGISMPIKITRKNY